MSGARAISAIPPNACCASQHVKGIDGVKIANFGSHTCAWKSVCHYFTFAAAIGCRSDKLAIDRFADTLIKVLNLDNVNTK